MLLVQKKGIGGGNGSDGATGKLCTPNPGIHGMGVGNEGGNEGGNAGGNAGGNWGGKEPCSKFVSMLWIGNGTMLGNGDGGIRFGNGLGIIFGMPGHILMSGAAKNPALTKHI